MKYNEVSKLNKATLKLIINKPEDRQGAVYNIKCCDCQASYIGETGKHATDRTQTSDEEWGRQQSNC